MRTLIVALALAALPVWGITNGSAPDPDDQRFDAVGAFAVTWRLGLASGHTDDADNAWYCAATLIDSWTVVTAQHCVAPYGETQPHAVRFRRQTDGSLGSLDAGVASFYHAYIASFTYGAAGQDVAFGHLSAPVYHIQPIEIGSAGPESGDQIINVGWGRQGPGFGAGPATELRLCNNYIGEVVNSGGILVYYFGQPYGAGPAYGYYDNDCGTNKWDSGSPILVNTLQPGQIQTDVIDTGLRVTGIVSTQQTGAQLLRAPFVTTPPHPTRGK